MEVVEFSNHLNCLKQCTAGGHDNFPSRVLRITGIGTCQHYISYNINNSLFSAKFPDSWKIARVSHIFKGNLAHDRDNYCSQSMRNELNISSVLTCAIKLVFIAIIRFKNTPLISAGKFFVLLCAKYFT